MKKSSQVGIIISSLAGFYDVAVGGLVYRCRARGVFRKQKIKPVVGDQVEIELNPGETNYLVAVSPRKNALIRPLVANVSDLLVVISSVEPDFSLNLLDRFLIFFEHLGLRIHIYLSKIDLAEHGIAKIKQDLTYYQKIGYQVFFSDQPIAEVEQKLGTFSLLVLAGQSGAGKSTLLNRLKSDAQQKTGVISTSLNRGKHTTRQVQLFSFGKGYIADTPGFSSIDIFQIKINELNQLFPEFVANQNACRFRGCQHLNEPGCRIKELVASGEIMRSRYDHYVSMRNEINQDKMPEYRK